VVVVVVVLLSASAARSELPVARMAPAARVMAS